MPTTIEDLTQSRQAYSQQRQSRLQIARDDEDIAVQSENRSLENVREKLKEFVTSVEESVGRLKESYPIAMFPVRLETRFNRKADQTCELLVRIYPDAILTKTHQPLLTQEEFKAGEKYWEPSGDREEDNPKSKWSGLVSSYGPNRAAWIVRQTSDKRLKDKVVRHTDQSITPYVDLLPDKWLVKAYVNGEELQIESEGVRKLPESTVIREPLYLMPCSRAEEITLSDNLKVDKESLWLYDFAEAKNAGMAVRLKLPELPEGTKEYQIDKLLVLGVKSTMEADDSKAELEILIENHHYTRGFSFVPQGTATNNVTNKPSGYPLRDPHGEYSFEIECTEKIADKLKAPDNDLDGHRVKTALGLSDETIFNHVHHADGQEGKRAQRVAELLWPIVENYIKQMVAPMFAGQTGYYASARKFFINYVRGRGPYPAFRVGDVPYGLLPVTSLSDWEIQNPPTSDLLAKLKQMQSDWLTHSQDVMRVNKPDSDDYYEELIKSLAQSASSKVANLRLIQIPQNDVVIGLGGQKHPIEKKGFESDSAHPWSRFDTNTYRNKNPFVVSGNSKALLMKLLRHYYPDNYKKIIDEFNELNKISPDESERLISETLDVCSHRLDAWITAVATWQLDQMREAEKFGIYVGSYGWVLDLKESTKDKYSEGLIKAPSMNHAATAAVLYNANRTRSQNGNSPYALNLSSARVRKALWLLNGISTDTPLGMLLGYQFERSMHDAGLDKYIDEFRNAFQFATDRAIDTSSDEEFDKPKILRNVVDGFQLWETWQNGELWKTEKLGKVPQTDKLKDVLGNLDEMIDSVTDLLTAESVYQAVQGNTSGTGASLDSLSKGVHPPVPEIVKTPRTGIPLTHRVAFILNTPSANYWGNGPTPRSEASPHLNTWVGQLLIDVSNLKSVVCHVDATYPLIDESSLHPLEYRQVSINLEHLKLEPLDFLAIASSVEETAYDSELDRRVLHAAYNEIISDLSDRKPVKPPVGDFTFKINYDPRDEDYTFLQLLEIARDINDFLSHVRPLTSRDFALPEDQTESLNVQLPATKDQIITSLKNFLKDFEDISPISFIRRSAFYLTNAYPALATVEKPKDTVRTVAKRICDELNQRHLSLKILNDTINDLEKCLEVAGEEEQESITEQINKSKSILAGEMGQLFDKKLMLVPDLSLPPSIEFKPINAQPSNSEIDHWLSIAARVRKPLDRWRRLRIYTNVINKSPMNKQVIQLPFNENARWSALPFASDQKPSPGTTSIVLQGTNNLDETNPITGLLLDEWTEQIPNPEEETGVAFHYDNPNSEAPQAVLLAVPPPQKSWTLNILESTINETLELAKIRGVESVHLKGYERLLPMIYFDAKQMQR